MADIDSWDATKPAIGTSLRNSNPQILANWAALEDALNDDHDFPTSGHHTVVRLLVQAAQTGVADAGLLYSKDVSAKAELHYCDEDSNEVQITSGGALLGIPSGCIVIWTGTIANIPSGYYICDGNNNTPNLLAKMLRCVATAATNPGGTGGNDTQEHTFTSDAVTLAKANLPATPLSISTYQTGFAGGGSNAYSSNSGFTPITMYTENMGSGTSFTVPGTTDSSSNLPAYYSVAFIMKS